MKECINKGCSDDVSQAQKSGIDRKGKRMGKKTGRDSEPFGHLWLHSPCPLQRLDLTSHAIRSSANQQLGAQMKKCQQLPGAQQANRPCHGAFRHSQDPSSYSQSTTHRGVRAHILKACPTCTCTHVGCHSQLSWAIPDWFWQKDDTELCGSIRQVVLFLW